MTMTADTITPQRIDDLRASFQIAMESMERMHAEALFGDIDPTEAAAIINETVANLAIVAR
jgi:hypothetical protein